MEGIKFCSHWSIMFALTFGSLCTILNFAVTLAYDESMIYGKFPEGFKWGAATAAYQVRTLNFFQKIQRSLLSIVDKRLKEAGMRMVREKASGTGIAIRLEISRMMILGMSRVTHTINTKRMSKILKQWG